MNKAPSLVSLPTLGSRNLWSRSKTASTSPRSSKDLEDTQSEILDTNSSTIISGDPGQHRMVVAIDYGTTFSGKREGTLGRHSVLQSLELF